jgi:hypothetical protein
MHGTFNGIHLNRIIALKTTGITSGVQYTNFVCLANRSGPSKSLRLNVPALLILLSQTIEGVLV